MRRLWQRLSKREKGLLGLSFLILLLVLGRYFLISPLLERKDWVKTQLESQTQLMDNHIRYLSQKTALEAVLERTRGELRKLESLLISGDTPSVSASDLQNLVSAIAAKEGVQIIAIRVLNPETIGNYIKIPIQVEATGQIDQVANLIKGIQSAEKLLIVGELNLRPLFTTAVMAQQEGRNIPVQNLRASLIVSGFVRSKPAVSLNSESSFIKTRPEGG